MSKTVEKLKHASFSSLVTELSKAQNEEEVARLITHASHPKEKELLEALLHTRDASKFNEQYIETGLEKVYNQQFYKKYLDFQKQANLSEEEFTSLKGVMEGKTDVVFADLANFKAVNDLISYETGDAVLDRFMELTQNFSSDLISIRRGGDEFIFIGDPSTIKSFITYAESDTFMQDLNSVIPHKTMPNGTPIQTFAGMAHFDIDINDFEDEISYKTELQKRLQGSEPAIKAHKAKMKEKLGMQNYRNANGTVNIEQRKSEDRREENKEEMLTLQEKRRIRRLFRAKKEKQQQKESKPVAETLSSAENSAEVEEILSIIKNPSEKEKLRELLTTRDEGKFNDQFIETETENVYNQQFYKKFLDFKKEGNLTPEEFTSLKEVLEGKSEVIFADLANFKSVNDLINYETGDKVLLQFMELTQNYSSDIITVRRGGDEFIYIGEPQAMSDFMQYLNSDEFREELNGVIPEGSVMKTENGREIPIQTFAGMANFGIDVNDYDDEISFKEVLQHKLQSSEPYIKAHKHVTKQKLGMIDYRNADGTVNVDRRQGKRRKSEPTM